MKVLFHTNTLNYRGTAVAVADYAKYNQEILGNESVISFDASIPYEKDMGTEPAVVERLAQDFKLIPHNGTNLQQVIDNEKIDVAYFLRSGNSDWVPDNCQTAIHAVFQLCEPYGDRYAYISSWLADAMNARHNQSVPYVPHMVNLPEPTADYRQLLNIGQDKIIVGRIGGYYTFNLPWVKDAIVRLLEQRTDIVFVMVGTEPWINHPNVRFQAEIHDLQTKTNFINTCDAMIHARSNGESFGLAICESLALNKPVLAWEGGEDQHHTRILADSGLIYNQSTIFEKLNNICDYTTTTWDNRVAEFRPGPVMEKFKTVFL
jgi:glycosyltransferase involved in cell wall biosynthesis